jgi:Putative phage metallopeptidase
VRPQPPHSLFADINSPAFVPAEDMPEWIEATFLDPSSPLRKEEHAHLAHAEIFTIRGHDVEELLGVVCRYGADAADVRAIVDAANQPPVIARGQIAMLAAPAS